VGRGLTPSGSTRPAPAGDMSRTVHRTTEYPSRQISPCVVIQSRGFARRSARTYIEIESTVGDGVCDRDLCSARDALSEAILDRNRTAPRGAVPQSVNVCLLRSDTDAAGNSGKMCLEGIVSKEAAECALPVGTVSGLDQGEEPGQPGDDPGARSGVVSRSSGEHNADLGSLSPNHPATADRIRIKPKLEHVRNADRAEHPETRAAI
jgi:hypothetical protein